MKMTIALTIAIAAHLMPTSIMAYNREAFVTYARRHSEDTGLMTGKANTAVYRRYVPPGAYDCANFGSQCLIAGGIRFTPQGVATLTSPSDAPEKGTGQNTKSIIGTETRQFSRVISGAIDLYRSLTSGRHQGKNYSTTVDKEDTGTLWSQDLKQRPVKPGDIVFEVPTSPPGHTMPVTEVRRTPPPATQPANDLLITAHSSWRLDASMNTLHGDWKTNDLYHVVVMPDAPVFVRCGISTGGSMVRFSYGTATNVISPDGKAFLGKEDTTLTLVFDTDMDTSTAATVKLKLVGQEVVFSPHAATDWSNGWWTGATNTTAGLIKGRTWRGTLPLADMPAGRNEVAKVSVRAFATDGKGNDKDNYLDDYTDAACEIISVQVDTLQVTERRQGQ